MPRKAKIEAPAVDLVGQWPVATFRKAWRAVSFAACTPRDHRPVLARPQFLRHHGGVQLFATNSYLTCAVWLGEGEAPDPHTTDPDLVSFDDRWGVFPKWLAERSYLDRRSKVERDVRFVIDDGAAVFDRADDAGNGRDEVRFPLTLDAYPKLTSITVPPTEAVSKMAFGSPLVALHKIAEVYLGPVVFEFTGDPNGPQRWRVSSSDPALPSGIVMPVRGA